MVFKNGVVLFSNPYVFFFNIADASVITVRIGSKVSSNLYRIEKTKNLI